MDSKYHNITIYNKVITENNINGGYAVIYDNDIEVYRTQIPYPNMLVDKISESGVDNSDDFDYEGNSYEIYMLSDRFSTSCEIICTDMEDEISFDTFKENISVKYKENKEYDEEDISSISKTKDGVIYEKISQIDIKNILINEYNYSIENIAIEYKFQNNHIADLVVLKNNYPYIIFEIKRQTKDLKNTIENVINRFQSAIRDNIYIGIKYFVIYIDNKFYCYEFYNNTFNEIDDIPKNTTFDNSKLLPSFNSDNVKNQQDRLYIDNDIDAFAKLISQYRLSPPLAIGLFGKWGTGKSFFMDKLKHKVEEYKQIQSKEKPKDLDGKKLFCTDIVSIEFNAWHYSDTNLWASLVYKIFTDMNAYLKEKESDINIYEKLKSSEEELKALEKEKNSIKKEKCKNILQIRKEKNKRKNSYNELKTLKSKDIKTKVIDDIKDSDIYKDIQKEFTHSDFQEISKSYQELKSIYGTIKKAFSLFFTDDKFLSNIICYLLLFFIIVFGFSYLTDIFKLFNLDKINEVFEHISITLVGIVSVIIKFNKDIKDHITNANNFTKKIGDYLELYANTKSRILSEDSKKELELIDKIKELDEKLKNNKDKISKIDIQIENINTQIEEIENGTYLYKFISKKSKSYKEHLGLVSTIREDFEELECLVKKSRGDLDNKNNVKSNDYNKCKEYIGSKGIEKKFEIDRVVLYIDDLDRCNDEKVLQVLEAIHLLLAFELFIVVVGVDTRWLRKSLVKRHKGLIFENKDNEDIASPNDYLEKIFQIPFQTSELDSQKKNSYLESIMDVKYEDIKSEINDSNTKIKDNTSLIDSKQNKTVKINNNESSKKNDSKYDDLRFNSGDLRSIQLIEPLICNTPRSLNRFINIYKIIKCHKDIREEDYQKALLILAKNFYKDKYKDKYKDNGDGDGDGDGDKYAKILRSIDNGLDEIYDRAIKDTSNEWLKAKSVVERFKF